MVTTAKTQRKSVEARGENAQSSTETDVWIKRTKQDFELNEKQQNADNGAGRVYSSTALRRNYLWTSILVHGPEAQLPVDEYTRPRSRGAITCGRCTRPRSRGAITCGRVYSSTVPRRNYLWTSVLVHGPEAQLPVDECTRPRSRGAITCGQVYSYGPEARPRSRGAITCGRVYSSTVPRRNYLWTSILVHGPEAQLPVDEYTRPRSRGAITCGRVYSSTVPRRNYLWTSILVHGPEAQLPVDEYTRPRSRGAITCGRVYSSTGYNELISHKICNINFGSLYINNL